MAEMSNRARVGDAFDLLAQCLKPFVDKHMARAVGRGQDWADVFAASAKPPITDYSTDDPVFLLRVIADCWRGTFDRQLPRGTRNLVFTLRDKRNEWAHNRQIKLHDALYTLSGIVTLVEAVDASEAEPVRAMLDDLRLTQFERAGGNRQGAALNVVDAPRAGLRPWRELVHPHPDVHSADFGVAAFAADLELVRRGEGAAEYADARLFFERSYLTAGLRDLLTLAVKRVTGQGGQPVISCQTNFGGGKTHSLIALYHLLSGISLTDLPDDVADLVRDAGVAELPDVNRAVIVGNRFGAGETHPKPDGTEVNTIWGEIAWQLGGADAYELVADSDRNRTNPGDAIRDVLTLCSPCLVLIDEWVAYARELYEKPHLPGGSFDSQFSFAQTLSEAVKGTPEAVFVVSIPASEGSGAGDEAEASSLEVGGVAGREALKRLTNVTNRLAETWQPATGDESYEIVRRRLFQPLADEAHADRDATAEAFGRLYRSQRSEYPHECSEIAYEARIKSAYPIHPEVFDRLYQDWSAIDRFQRTRGVLRLMAATIDSLWRSDDRSPLILPCSIPLGDPRVTSELAGRLPDYWHPVIDADVDGQNSSSFKIDRETPHLGSLHATRRVARTIFVGATPNVGAANQGLEVRRIRLGSTFAGDKPGPISDALNRLAATAPHLYVDRDRYWFDRRQNVTRTARDDAERLLAGDRHEVRDEIIKRLRAQRGASEFANVHYAPASGADVADDPRARLVVLEPEAAHIAKSSESPALAAAREILNHRGAGPRQYRNMLVFAAADQRGMESLEQATAEYLAWSGICGRTEELNLDSQQARLATTQCERSEQSVELRMAEAYKYALVPRQDDPARRIDEASGDEDDRHGSDDRRDGGIEFDVVALDSDGSVAERASRKLVNDGALATQFPPVLLRQRLNGVLQSRWASGHVPVSTLWDDFARYVYLPRLRDQSVLLKTVEGGPQGFAWTVDGFGVAAGVDDATGRYLGLAAQGIAPSGVTPASLVVHPDRALAQIEAESERESEDPDSGGGGTEGPGTGPAGGGQPVPEPSLTTAFRGAVRLDPARPTLAFTRVSEEVLTHLLSQPDIEAEVRLEVEVRKADGFSDHVVRTVTENARELHFEDGSGFSDT